MVFLKFLLAILMMIVGFFFGGNLTQEIVGAVIGSAIGLVVALIVMEFWRGLVKLAITAIGIFGVVVLVGYIQNQQPQASNPPDERPGQTWPKPESEVEALLPHFSQYYEVDGQLIAEAGGVVGSLPGAPKLVAPVSEVVGCYQEENAVRMRVYVDKQEVSEAGVVAIVDQNELSDPINLATCLPKAILPASGTRSTQSVRLEPCSNYYTLPRGSNVIHIAYASDSDKMCRNFCSQLEGCTKH